jgi:hypothetical protein
MPASSAFQLHDRSWSFMERPEPGNDAPAFAAMGIIILVVLGSIGVYLLLLSR